MSSKFIYIIFDDLNCLYVGQTKHPEKRFREHLWRKEKSTLKNNWIAHRRENGLPLHFEVIDEVPFKEWEFWEVHYISLFRSWGFNIKNSDNGGLGSDKWTPEMKIGHSRNLKGKIRPARERPVYQYSMSGEFLKEFKSCYSVTREGFCHVNVKRAARNPSERSAGGYRWSFEKVESVESKASCNQVKVVQIDPLGITPPIIHDGMQNIPGYSAAKICRCCKGLKPQYKGYKWMYYKDFLSISDAKTIS
jgi:hypothetical protein